MSDVGPERAKAATIVDGSGRFMREGSWWKVSAAARLGNVRPAALFMVIATGAGNVSPENEHDHARTHGPAVHGEASAAGRF